MALQVNTDTGTSEHCVFDYVQVGRAKWGNCSLRVETGGEDGLLEKRCRDGGAEAEGTCTGVDVDAGMKMAAAAAGPAEGITCMGP